jgi:hypothetical protein
MVVNKIEPPFNFEFDYGASSEISIRLRVDIGLANKGLGIKASSNSFILFFSIKFSFSSSLMEYFRESPVE